MDSIFKRIRTAIEADHAAIPVAEVSQLLRLTEYLARKYAITKDFLASFPAIAHPGQHSALRSDESQGSKAFFELMNSLIIESQAFASREETHQRFNCQCCGLPVLSEDPLMSEFESCAICSWEQERVSDPAIASGGPNGALSLEEARSHFNKNFSIFLDGKRCSI
jgi:hypothetical protein